MPTDAEITFADHMGRYYARRFSFPPMVGRLLGYLAVCDPPDPTIGELAEALLASRSAIAGAVKVLETIHAVRRSRVAGERMDRIRIDLSSAQSMGMDVTEYEELLELAREGLDVLRDAPVERRAVLLETAAFAEFLVERMPQVQQEWEARRQALVASGDLPETRPGQGGTHDETWIEQKRRYRQYKERTKQLPRTTRRRSMRCSGTCSSSGRGKRTACCRCSRISPISSRRARQTERRSASRRGRPRGVRRDVSSELPGGSVDQPGAGAADQRHRTEVA